MYGTLEVLGPEHEFSIVDEKLTPLPIVDKVIRDVHGRLVNCASLGACSFGKELQAHVAEFKANKPFVSPVVFEETMQKAVEAILGILESRYNARLLGSGMHPFLRLRDARVWSHRDRGIYAAMSGIFNLNQHGWLNIQSFQLNLPYKNEGEAPQLLAGLFAAPLYGKGNSSYRLNTLHNIFYFTTLLEGLREPLHEGKFTEFRNNFYRELVDGDSDE